jgi:iron complex transport system substrate-binding protein
MTLLPTLPQRIVCLTEETTETLYLLGAEDAIVGISGFTVRPKEARKTKPKVSTYLDANIAQILALKPDVVLAWSDLQANICADLIREGVEVLCFNHRTIAGILGMMLRLGALVGKAQEAEQLTERIATRLQEIQRIGAAREIKPRVYFEEWYDPLISGIAWVSELIDLCGGIDIFSEHRQFPDAKRRIIADPTEVIRRKPDIIIASWCGKMFKPERLKAREGWAEIPAVRHNSLFELHSSVILQPGPAALTDGVEYIFALFNAWKPMNN